jgi:hypothetical protein
MTVEADLEAARLAAQPDGSDSKLKRKVRAAEARATNAENLRSMERLELAEVRTQLEAVRKRAAVLEETLRIQPAPAYSAKQVNTARAQAARADDAKRIAQTARDEARVRAEAAETARDEALADCAHTVKHADQRVAEAERDRDGALAKAAAAKADGVKTGIDTMQRAFVSALLMEKQGAAPGSIVVTNTEREPIDERVMEAAWSLVGKLAELRDAE